MIFGIPQIIFVCWLMLGVGVHLAKHGEPNESKYNVFLALISTGLQFVLLYWGGFFGTI